MYCSVKCHFIHQPVWQLSPVHAHPMANTLYVWQGNITDLPNLYAPCAALLNDDERAKAARYHQQADRERYVLQHGLLRLLLGWYLSQPVADISFALNPHKKPYLLNNSHTCYFNSSHSGPELLIAIADRDLGADIERVDYNFQHEDIMSQYFNQDEAAFINGANDATAAFFLLWTRKEALLKAIGTGIGDHLPQIPALDGKHQLPDAYPAVDWLTESFKTNNNCMVSIASPAPPTSIILQQINMDWITALLKERGT